MIEVEFTVNGLEYSKILDKAYTWNELEDIGFKFSDGWRVPKRSELIELFDSEEKSRDNSYLWSSSAFACSSDGAWSVLFSNGFSFFYNRTNYCNVRLVRGVNNGN